jgi:hypothetical protein
LRYCVGITMANERGGLYATLYEHQFCADRGREPAAEPTLAGD